MPSVPELRWFDVPGARMPYLEFGDPTGAPVLVLPGLSDGLAPVSDPQARAVMPPSPRELAGYRVLVLSHRHPLPDGATTVELAVDVHRFLDGVVGQAAIVCGHSLGAMIAQHLAAGWPMQVRRLVLSATLASADEALRSRTARWDELVRAGDWRAFYTDALRVSYTGSELLRRRLALRLLGSGPPDGPAGRHLALSAACRTHDASRVLGQITAPTLVLAGSHDFLTRPGRALELADLIPDARVRILPGLAHGFPEQARRRYVRHLRQFLAAGAGD